MGYYWSAATNSFYPDDLRSAYEASGSWPDDAQPIGDAVFAAFAGVSPAGKVRGSINGQPAWIDAPLPNPVQTQDVLVALLDQKEDAGVYFQPSGASALILFGTDDAALVRYLGIWTAIKAGLWTGGVIRAADQTPVLISAADAGELIKKALTYISLCGAQYGLLRHRLTIDPTADITQGWPPQT